MSATLIALISVCLPTIISIVFGVVLKKNAEKSAVGTKLQALEAQAFEKAKDQYIDAIDWQKRDNVALREEIDAMTTVKAGLRSEMRVMRSENDQLRRELDECARRCASLEAAVKAASGTVGA